MKILPALKLPVLLALAGLLLNGCVCPVNKKQGIPTITCQPVDTKVVEGKSAYFEVRTRQSKCRYEWFRIRATDHGPVEESQQSKTGGMSNRLIFENVSKADRGVYYCTIIHETMGTKGDVPSRTRNVELMVLSTNKGPQFSTKTLASSGGRGHPAMPSQRHLYHLTELHRG